MSKKISKNKNFLELIPIPKAEINWQKDKEGMVTLEIENKGFFNFLAQKLFKKPKISFVHLDETGSFIWPLLDGKADVEQIAQRVKEHFGQKADPLYERLCKYIKILESYGFIQLSDSDL